MKRLFLLIILTAFTSTYSQTVKVTDSDNEIIFEIFNGNWQHADSLIDVQLQLNPNHPKYYFMKAYNAYYCRFMTRSGLARDVSLRRVIDNTWRGIQIGEAIPQTTEVKFYLGNCYAFLSRANIMKQQYWLGYWNAGKSEDYYEDVLDEDPNVTDAYLNLGVMEYFPDAMVEGFQYFLAWLGGAGGDKKTGLEYLNRVAESGTLFKEEAKIALARGAELAGTGICSGEGGMLPEEQAANSRYFYELASAKFGYDERLLRSVQCRPRPVEPIR